MLARAACGICAPRASRPARQSLLVPPTLLCLQTLTVSHLAKRTPRLCWRPLPASRTGFQLPAPGTLSSNTSPSCPSLHAPVLSKPQSSGPCPDPSWTSTAPTCPLLSGVLRSLGAVGTCPFHWPWSFTPRAAQNDSNIQADGTWTPLTPHRSHQPHIPVSHYKSNHTRPQCGFLWADSQQMPKAIQGLPAQEGVGGASGRGWPQS